MEYQKIANLLESVTNQPSKFRTRNWVEINDESTGTYTSNDIKFKTTMLRSKLFVPVVTLSTQDNSKLLQQLKSSFKRTINWNKY